MCVRNLGRLEQLALGVVQRIATQRRVEPNKTKRTGISAAPASNPGEPLGRRSFRFRHETHPVQENYEQNLAQLGRMISRKRKGNPCDPAPAVSNTVLSVASS